MLPPTGASIQVAFYSTPAAQLAEKHPIVAALLKAQPHARNGCYTLPMAAFVRAAAQPPHQVRLLPSLHLGQHCKRQRLYPSATSTLRKHGHLLC